MEDLLDPKSAALRAHCCRVSAWALEIGAALKLSKHSLAVLSAAAKTHHSPLMLRHDETFNRLSSDLHLQQSDGGSSPHTIVDRVVMAAAALPDCRRLTEPILLLARVLDLANYFDEQLEMAPYEGRSLDKVFDDVLKVAKDGLFDAQLVLALGSLRKVDRVEVLQLIPKLPVYPAVAVRAMRVAANPDVTIRELEAVCLQDQVLTGHLLELANSAEYSPRLPITSVVQAATYIGLETTRRLLAAACVRPLFASTRLRALWKHSLECASLAETIATLSCTVDPREAFVAGLLHDIGSLAFSLLPRDVGESCDRLVSAGCEPLIAEMVLTGFDHGQAGGEILKKWQLPKSLVDAVYNHHQPDETDCDLASVLYLTEFWAASEEDLPSNRRLTHALKRLQISPELLDTANLARLGVLESVLH